METRENGDQVTPSSEEEVTWTKRWPCEAGFALASARRVRNKRISQEVEIFEHWSRCSKAVEMFKRWARCSKDGRDGPKVVEEFLKRSRCPKVVEVVALDAQLTQEQFAIQFHDRQAPIKLTLPETSEACVVTDPSLDAARMCATVASKASAHIPPE